MRVNVYVVVFGLVGLVVAAAALSALLTGQNSTGTVTDVSKLPNFGPAPSIHGIASWINSPPLNTSELKGKVVLVDFWTYSCINCIRTIPYLNAWFSRYAENGLVIIGMHTPEFQFEKNYTDVLSAVRNFGIRYPVALDSDYAMWNAFKNHYWPADYLLDKNGDIREIHVGEGEYDSTELLIQGLLRDAGFAVSPGIVADSVNAAGVNFSDIGTPELYVGYGTARAPIGNPQGFTPEQVVDYTITGSMQNSTVYFSGKWFNAQDSMISMGNSSRIFLIYKAKDVNIVAQGNFSMITAKLDGKDVPVAYLGGDLELHQGVASANIETARLYSVIDGPSYGWHLLEITAGPGFRLYTFTFG